MKKTGAHLYGCFTDPAVKQRGWKMIQTANRSARRLGIGGLV